MAQDCSESCSCEDHGEFTCEPVICVENANCSVHGGVRGCFCIDLYSGDGEEECTLATTNPTVLTSTTETTASPSILKAECCLFLIDFMFIHIRSMDTDIVIIIYLHILIYSR